VHTEDPFKNPDSVIEYLARYTHKIAISNYRIKAVDENSITFTYLDRANNNRKETMILPAEKFINRFCCMSCPGVSVKSDITVFSQRGQSKIACHKSGLV
jgi:hypothetical protein